MANTGITDEEMDSVTPYSNWERLNNNDNPSDRFNCFIVTAAGPLGFGSVIEFEKSLNSTQFVKNALSVNRQQNIDYNRGAYLDEVKQFYSDLGIRYVNEFIFKNEVINYLKNNVKIGEKKKFALGYCYDETTKNAFEASIGYQIQSSSLGHIIAIKVDKTQEKYTFRTIDFQLPRDNSKRFIKDDLPSNSIPPYHLFEKNVY